MLNKRNIGLVTVKNRYFILDYCHQKKIGLTTSYINNLVIQSVISQRLFLGISRYNPCYFIVKALMSSRE